MNNIVNRHCLWIRACLAEGRHDCVVIRGHESDLIVLARDESAN